MLHQLALDEEYALECAHLSWEEERARVEEEWRKGRERIRDRMLEGIEDRRKRAREDKDGEGTVAGEWYTISIISLSHNCPLFTRCKSRRTIPTSRHPQTP